MWNKKECINKKITPDMLKLSTDKLKTSQQRSIEIRESNICGNVKYYMQGQAKNCK